MMRAFAALFDAIDSTTSTNLKVAAMTQYLSSAAPADAAWAVYFLSGRKLKRLVGNKQLRGWLGTLAALPDWLLEETYAQVGDLAETIALLADGSTGPNDTSAADISTATEISAPPEISAAPDIRAARETPAAADAADVSAANDFSAEHDTSLCSWIERLLELRGLDEEQQRGIVVRWWRELPYLQCLVVNKLLTGAFRIGVSQTLLTRALAAHLDVPVASVAYRLMGRWNPTPGFWHSLAEPDEARGDESRPYPFFLASPLETAPASLGPVTQWQAEWKWDGIRAQVMRRPGAVYIWSRGEDLVTEQFPEIAAGARQLPENTIVDGEIVAWNERGIMPFTALQTRLNRKRLGPKLLESAPVRFLAYDLLEERGEDLRSLSLAVRRARLEVVLAHAPTAFELTQPLAAHDWDELARLRLESRARNVEGLMLKRLDSNYGTGRQRGAWWKWKIEPYTIDAVMLYAQPGHGRRASLYTDYTFAVWRDGELVPIAKAYSGLDNREILSLDRWIRAHTLERFGPVRSVEPIQVFELAFEGINRSPRHRSGVALRFPRIARWRTDKPATEADTLDRLQSLL